jgi:hypothetical protein
MKVEIWLMVDENGNAVATADEAATLASLYDEVVGEDSAIARRIVKLTLKIDAPKPIELSATIPNDASGEIALTVN